MFKRLIHVVRMTAKSARPTRASTGAYRVAPRKNHCQRCAVRVTYSPNRVRGQWAAHGRYIARGSATWGVAGHEAGFSAEADGIDIAKTLNDWQSAGDERLFKMIISPEFGERLDLSRHTRELLARMSQDLGLQLEWVAVAHYNTDHPHFHVALRGRTNIGPLRLDRNYIKQGIRNNAETLCTAQLGFRTELDALEAERREVDAQRITSLDRTIAKHAFGPGADGTFDLEALPPARYAFQRPRRLFLAGRLRNLVVLDLATAVEAHRWQIDPTFLSRLRSMQISQDRQKMLALGELPPHRQPETIVPPIISKRSHA
jgi:hypothetical protein